MKRMVPIAVAVLALVVGAMGHAGLGGSTQESEAGAKERQPLIVQQKATAIVPERPAAKLDTAFERAKADAAEDAASALGVTICRFLGEYVGPVQESLNPSSAKDVPYCPGIAPFTSLSSAPGAKPDPGQHSFEVMLAVLPDPVHTHLALRFDRSVDAIQNSLQDLGWTFDSAWMPWEQREHEETGAFGERVTTEKAKNEFEYVPGVMLFRNEGEGTRPLVVLTVGDTPTSGVNARQFRRAMEIYKRLTGWDAYFTAKPAARENFWNLAVLGPTYSGSAHSLRRLLEEVTASVAATPSANPNSFSCPRRGLRIAVSTGTMSDSTSVDSLAPDWTECETLTLESRSFSVDIYYEYTELVDFLERHHHLEHEKSDIQVGLLSEEESRFGNTLQANQVERDEPEAFKDERKSAYRKRHHPDTARGGHGSPSAGDDQEPSHAHLAAQHHDRLDDDLNTTEDEINRQKNADKLFAELAQPRKYYFPREISTLRSAYEQSGIFGFGAGSDNDKTQLHLSFGSDTRADDSVHTFAGKQGAVAMEAQMGQLAAALEQDRINVVLLSATDTLDDIFVTRYLTEHAPNVAVIVMDADELFLRSGSSGMQNVYAVSPWPLLPRNSIWSAANDAEAYTGVPQPRLFPSGSTQGLYNAARVLLCDPGLWGIAHTPNACRASDDTQNVVGLREYRPPVGLGATKTSDLLTGPPLWLMSISRGGFWPVALIDVDQMADCLPESAWFNLPPMNSKAHTSLGNCTSGLGYDPVLEQEHALDLPAVTAVGVHEHAPRSAKVLMAIMGLLLLWHGAACLYCRLDRNFAWSYALAETDHLKWRLSLQIGLALLALPVFDLLDPLILPDMSVRTTEFIVMDVCLQGLALVVTAIPLYLWLGKGAWKLDAQKQRTRWIGMTWRLALGALLAVGLHWLVWFLIAPPSSMPTERAFFLYRSSYIFSGSSPALPLLLLLGALAIALLSRFQRLVFYKGRIPQLPRMDRRFGYPGPHQVQTITNLLAHMSNPLRRRVLGVLCVLLATLLLAFPEAIPRSLAHGRFDFWIVLLSGLVLLLLLHDLAISLLAWIMLRSEVLIPLTHSPIRWGFTWIEGFSWENIWAPGAMSRHHLFRYMLRLEEANRRDLKDAAVGTAFDNLRSAYRHSPAKEGWASQVTEQLDKLHGALALSATEKLENLTSEYAKDIGPITGEKAKERGLPEELPLDDAVRKNRPEALNRVAQEEFVALLYLGYIRMVLLQIRNRLITAACLFVLLLWALTGYSFLNHHAILISMTCLFLVLASVIILIYAQMHRDEILSRTTETTSGELGADFFTKVLGMVGLPLATLIASQFPELSNLIFSWVEPGLSTVR